MAKHKSIIQPTGTLFGVNFYMRKGKPVARKAGGGFTANSIKKGREYGTGSGNVYRIWEHFYSEEIVSDEPASFYWEPKG